MTTSRLDDEAHIGRVDLPSPSLLCIELRRRNGSETVVIGARDGALDVGTLPSRPRGTPANAFVMALRKRLAGGSLAAERLDDARVTLRVVAANGQRFVIACAAERGRLRCTLATDSGVTIASHGAPVPAREAIVGGAAITFDTRLAAQGRELADSAATTVRAARVAALTARVRRQLKRLERREQAVRADLDRVADALALQARANLLLPMIGRVPKGAEAVDATDWAVDPPAIVRITLDPAIPLREQIDAMFRRANRILRGEATARARLGETEQAREALQRWFDTWITLDPATDEGNLEAAESEAEALGVPRAGSPPPRVESTTPARRVPFRTFTDEHGREIRVGKGAASNDALTLHHAKPWDLWLHARGVSGAHVVVPLTRGTECPAELLVDAATLAAHFSDARSEAVVEVDYVARRYVRKPRGAAAGSVSLERERVIAVRMDDSRRRRLLDSERT